MASVTHSRSIRTRIAGKRPADSIRPPLRRQHGDEAPGNRTELIGRVRPQTDQVSNQERHMNQQQQHD